MTARQNWRIRVACINWSHPDAPHAMCYLDDPAVGAVGVSFHATWRKAMERAEMLARFLGVEARLSKPIQPTLGGTA